MCSPVSLSRYSEARPRRRMISSLVFSRARVAFVDQGLQVALLVAQRQVGLHPGPEDGGFDGLGDVIHPAGLEPHSLVRGVVQGGYEDHRDVARQAVGLEQPAGFQTVQAWHHDVEQDEVRVLAAGDVDGADAVAGHEHAVLAFQEVHEHDDVLGLVVHHQHGGFVGCLVRTCGGAERADATGILDCVCGIVPGFVGNITQGRGCGADHARLYTSDVPCLKIQ